MHTPYDLGVFVWGVLVRYRRRQ